MVNADYKGDGVEVWEKKDDSERKYLEIKVLGSINLKAYKQDETHEERLISVKKVEEMLDELEENIVGFVKD